MENNLKIACALNTGYTSIPIGKELLRHNKFALEWKLLNINCQYFYMFFVAM